MTLIDTNINSTTTIVVNNEDIVLNITTEGIIIDFWDDPDNDGEADRTICMTFDEWRTFARSFHGNKETV